MALRLATPARDGADRLLVSRSLGPGALWHCRRGWHYVRGLSSRLQSWTALAAWPSLGGAHARRGLRFGRRAAGGRWQPTAHRTFGAGLGVADAKPARRGLKLMITGSLSIDYAILCGSRA